MRIGLRARVSISVSQRRLVGEVHAEGKTGLRTVNRQRDRLGRWVRPQNGCLASEDRRVPNSRAQVVPLSPLSPTAYIESGTSEVTKHTPTPDVLVGRDHELKMLRAVLDAGRSGGPTIALLVGEPGIGKTRLADEAAIMARAHGMRVLRGEANRSRREPMELWRGVYYSLGLEAVSEVSLPAEERRWELLESLADALTSCAPALVVLEDLHWADPMAIWVLDHLTRTLGDAPVALVATSRDHEPDMPRIDG